MSGRQNLGAAQESAVVVKLARLRTSAWWEPVRNLVIALLAVLFFWLTVHPIEVSGRAVQYSLAGLAIVGVVASTWVPWLGVLISASATAAAWLLGLTFDPFVMTGIGLFTIAERRGSRAFPPIMIVSLAGLFLVLLTLGVDGFEARVRSGLLIIAIPAASWVLGARTRQVRLEAAARSRVEERLTICRDFHDTLSHSLGAIGVLAGVTARLGTVDEASLRDTLREIEDSALSGMSELKAFLQQQRNAGRTASVTDSARDESAASWSLSQALTSIANAAEKVGVSTDLSITGDVDALPAAVRTTVYRVAQEAATNVVRHASATTALISVKASATEVEVRVCDDGCGRTSSLREGHGLAGMRERARLLSGTVSVDDCDNVGLAVVVRLPVLPEPPRAASR